MDCPMTQGEFRFTAPTPPPIWTASDPTKKNPRVRKIAK